MEDDETEGVSEGVSEGVREGVGVSEGVGACEVEAGLDEEAPGERLGWFPAGDECCG